MTSSSVPTMKLATTPVRRRCLPPLQPQGEAAPTAAFSGRG
jgi:hypothetical protein